MKYKYVREKGMNEGMRFVTSGRSVERKEPESPEEFMEGISGYNTFKFVKRKPLAKIKKAFSKLEKYFYSFTKSIAQEVIIRLIMSLLAPYIVLVLYLTLH